MDENLLIEIVKAGDLSAAERQTIIDFCNRAYEDDLSGILDSFVNPTHLCGFLRGVLVSHALWITRWLQVAGRPPMRTAYVEAVATEQAYRSRGYASAILKRLEQSIQDYEIAALGPSDPAYYARLGWELWRGPLFVRTAHGLTRSPDDEQVMILRLPNTPDLDLDAPLSVEWRVHEVW